MAKKSADVNKTLATTLITAGAVFAVRKLLAYGWKRATGKTPPDAADPQVSVIEALGWAALAGVTVEATKLLTARATARRSPEAIEEADS